MCPVVMTVETALLYKWTFCCGWLAAGCTCTGHVAQANVFQNVFGNIYDC